MLRLGGVAQYTDHQALLKAIYRGSLEQVQGQVRDQRNNQGLSDGVAAGWDS